jgi:hypothetical protein
LIALTPLITPEGKTLGFVRLVGFVVAAFDSCRAAFEMSPGIDCPHLQSRSRSRPDALSKPLAKNLHPSAPSVAMIFEHKPTEKTESD